MSGRQAARALVLAQRLCLVRSSAPQLLAAALQARQSQLGRAHRVRFQAPCDQAFFDSLRSSDDIEMSLVARALLPGSQQCWDEPQRGPGSIAVHLSRCLRCCMAQPGSLHLQELLCAWSRHEGVLCAENMSCMHRLMLQ